VLAPLLADSETRAWAYECCAAAGALEHVPSDHATPVALAASAVTAYCAQPWLLGTAPADAEFMATMQDGPGEMDWWYLFRVRAPAGHPLRDDGGIAAAAGPLPHPEDPAGAVPGSVASLGDRWDARPVAGHFAALLPQRQPFPLAPPCR
jgi:hypothetical protein